MGKAFTEDPITGSVGLPPHLKPAYFHCLGSLTFVSATSEDDLLLVPSKATALWLKEPAAKVGALSFLWNGGGHILFWLLPFRLWTFFAKLGTKMDKNRDAFAKEHGSFYYLHFIAIVPEARGQGLFRQLMQPVLTKADAQGKWCYLEASSQKSADAYQRMGFRQREEWRVWPEANPFYSMERPPQTAVS
ncbi:hypothetical protein WJX74_001132 [Apatococcus lobatus]|uniref:N-acetyltransferase domain-containing protein n=2 Tax=Apatococcus TaxID=904362 RepID=A0AAW1SMB4_9CHLO